MDGAFIGSITISINKAYTAIAFQTQTKDLVDVTQSGQPLFGFNDAVGGRIVSSPAESRWSATSRPGCDKATSA